jgi:HNH endonuclease
VSIVGPEIITGGPFEVDHIVPQASAGGDEPDNLALCCKSCNIRKSDHSFGIDPERRKETPLFNPCQHAWSEHFHFSAGSFQLLGKTPVGRATIAKLRMNTSYQIEARKYWMEAGLYP